MDQTLNRIDRVMERVRTHPEYSDFVRSESYNALVKDANRYSLKIESLMQEPPPSKTFNTEEKELCFKALERGREYLGREGVSLISMCGLGHIVAPFDREGVSTPKGFRRTDVIFGEFSGVSFEAIHQEIDNLIYFINQSANVHPIIRAAATHLDLVRIQPYLDGNSRSARLIQNYLLENRDYPPAIITDGEKDHYLTLRSGVFREGRPILLDSGKPTYFQQAFYTFIASKVLESATRLDGQLKSNRIYHVNLKGIDDKKVCYSITKSLKSMVRGRGRPLKASISKGNKKKYALEIQGDIGLFELKAFFEKVKSRYGFRYSLISVA